MTARKYKRPPTAYAVFCKKSIATLDGCEDRCSHLSLDGAIFLTEEEYELQMNNPDDAWTCPVCGGSADWDDYNYDRAMAALELNDKGLFP